MKYIMKLKVLHFSQIFFSCVNFLYDGICGVLFFECYMLIHLELPCS